MGNGWLKSKEVRGPSKHALNRWVSYTMPVIMAGLVGFATWVFVALVCVNHLLIGQGRKGTAIALLVVYFILFSLMSSAYLRVVWVVNFSPGFVTKQSTDLENEKFMGSVESQSDPEIGLGGVQAEGWRREEETIQPPEPVTIAGRAPENETESLSDALQSGPTKGTPRPGLSPEAIAQSTNDPSAFSPPASSNPLLRSQAGHGVFPENALGSRPYGTYGPPRPETSAGFQNLDEWFKREAFVCENDGLPRWCDRCQLWKPDRSHHCSELQRCVWRMDHFCPWVGGVVAEPSYKFFYQTVFYGALYCLFIIISIAVIFQQQINDNGDQDARWAACLALACVFGLFSGAMTGSTTQLIYQNVSTIDSLNYKTKVYQLALHDPNAAQTPPPSQQTSAVMPTRVWLPQDPGPGQRQRCFVIVSTQPGDNPWRLASTLENFQEVLGYSFWDWWLPIKRSPLETKKSGEGWYRWNEELLARLKHQAGITQLSGQSN
ncbi:zf-DHHC-domain-containing protein [Choiromyces venosus 120613-1]|uniref:Palmitoyltransferase n=1 Tax=Choiromyces venosus 120613-1 TaxID=1336337 RepID=A0A3N4K9C3_9PEZI|nr:zf-DHHC-domain-containing protein [Choiromyces venosus 120613-1]